MWFSTFIKQKSKQQQNLKLRGQYQQSIRNCHKKSLILHRQLFTVKQTRYWQNDAQWSGICPVVQIFGKKWAW
jgi:hypothetical protein